MFKDGFVDLNKIKILLWVSDDDSRQEICTLLSECHYQVRAVRTVVEVIEALDVEGVCIDMLLFEADLDIMESAIKMLHYIAANRDFHHIPPIMLIRQDEVCLVAKCLKLGVADYLVKPLRKNLGLSLWKHVSNTRQMVCVKVTSNLYSQST